MGIRSFLENLTFQVKRERERDQRCLERKTQKKMPDLQDVSCETTTTYWGTEVPIRSRFDCLDFPLDTSVIATLVARLLLCRISVVVLTGIRAHSLPVLKPMFLTALYVLASGAVWLGC
jgi:hypothetical protein